MYRICQNCIKSSIEENSFSYRNFAGKNILKKICIMFLGFILCSSICYGIKRTAVKSADRPWQEPSAHVDEVLHISPSPSPAALETAPASDMANDKNEAESKAVPVQTGKKTKKKVIIPALVGDSFQTAVRKLKKRQVIYELIWENSTEKRGTVLKQSQKEGTKISKKK